ncbi:MAG: AAA family ATPase, partial [Chitinophagaceae bacterium]|nr:AAA family ATPase [Chitinophagaceae bacterium]
MTAMEIIKSVEITNFRSIQKLETPISATHLNIIVGKNDIGKSNFLKALNLFFNNETEIAAPFRFQDDFCKHATTPAKKAPEITIKIEFAIPTRFKDYEPLIWTKVWRREGLHSSTIMTKNGEVPSAKGGGVQWVNKIKYKYIPAIRGAEYFNYLMGELHDAFSEIDPEAFQTVSTQFTKGLKKQVDLLVQNITQRLGYNSQIGMPSNFRQLFATLDFSLNQSGVLISLNKKGDGIKAQHIPIILKTIADHYKSVTGHAVIAPETIWGFEEPENNMEMGNAFKLADIFQIFSEDLQIFINTHSPAFYSLAKKEGIPTILYLVKHKTGT